MKSFPEEGRLKFTVETRKGGGTQSRRWTLKIGGFCESKQINSYWNVIGLYIIYTQIHYEGFLVGGHQLICRCLKGASAFVRHL